MWTESGMGGREKEERGRVVSKEGIHERLSGRKQKKKVIFIIWVLAKSTDVCIACKCWIFAHAKIFRFVCKHLCASQQLRTEDRQMRREEGETGKESDITLTGKTGLSATQGYTSPACLLWRLCVSLL